MSQDRLEKILEVTSEGYWDWDLKTDRAYLSPHYCELIGYSPEETIFDSLFLKSIIHPDDLAKVFTTIEEHLQGKIDISLIEYRMFSKNGALKWIEGRGKIVEFDEQGNPVRMVGTIMDITRRKVAENALIASNERLNIALAASKTGVWDWDLRTNSVQWSPEVHNIVGIADFNGTLDGFAELLHPDDAERVKESVDSALTHRKAYADEFRIILPDGELRWLYNLGVPTYDENGMPVRLIGTVKDITERKQIEEKLRLSENKFATVFRVSPDSININRLSDGLYVDINSGFTSVTGYTPEDVCGRSSFELNIWDNPEDRDHLVSGLKSQGEVNNLEARFRCKDGSIVTGLMSARIIEVCGELCILSITRDITERKKIEKTLNDMLCFLSNITDRVPGVVYQFRFRRDGTSCFPFTSDKFREIFQIDPDEVLKDSTRLFKRVHPDDLESVTSSIQTSALELTPWYQEFRIILDDGTVRWVSGNSLPQREEDGSVLWNGFSADITDRRNKDEQLRQAKASAESANRAKSEFLANMSHEIRTPMNGVLGMAQLLEMTDLSDEQQEYLNTLTGSGKNLLSIINDILDLSRIEAGGVELELAEFTLLQCINDIIKMQKVAALQKGLIFNADIDVEIPHGLLGDQLKIKQIILNLLGNAVKFTSKGSITLSARMLEQHDTFVLIQIVVQDTGIGITAESLDRIFNPFVQEDGSTSRRYGGTGLGLSICRRLTELMGGSIAVESSPGTGSCFTVTLPLVIATETVTIQEAPQKNTISWHGPPLRILFVEDDPSSLEVGTSLLRVLGHDVMTAENGKKCLTALENDSFDLVLMDIQMPVMNGEEAMIEIRKRDLETCAHQKVISISAHALRGDMERFLAVGFDGHVSKPIDFIELLSVMSRVMGLADGTA
jgi:PAS domain S-box-containing protein